MPARSLVALVTAASLLATSCQSPPQLGETVDHLEPSPTDQIGGLTGGATRHTFDVTPSGAATLSIPLWVPPGRAGMQPELALAYSSSGGYGNLGVGFALAGIPRITRCAPTASLDGEFAPIDFPRLPDPIEPGVFCLDGARLVLTSGEPGQLGAEYRVLPDRHVKVVVSANSGPNPTPDEFKIYEQGGRIWTMRNIASYFSGVVAWEAVRAEDRAGNSMTLYYGSLSAPAGSYPELSLIIYAAHPGLEGGAVRAVQFEYEPHPEPNVTFVAGDRSVRASRIAAIEMAGPAPVQVGTLRRYEIDYTTTSITGRSLIRSVQECDGAGICKRPIELEWERGSTEFEAIDTGIAVASEVSGTSTEPHRIHAGDFNGDGREDLLYSPQQAPNVFAVVLADPSHPRIYASEVATGIAVPRYNSRPSLFDFDFDGRTDVMSFDAPLQGCQAGVCDTTNTIYFGPQFGATVSVPNAELARVADFNGDGLSDIALSTYADHGRPTRRWSYQLNLGGQLAPSPSYFTSTRDAYSAGYSRTLPMFQRGVDFDGDGAGEFLAAAHDGANGPARYYGCKLARLAGTACDQTDLAALTPNATNTAFLPTEYLAPDLNGDGLGDVVTWAGFPGSLIQYRVNTGRALQLPVAVSSGNPDLFDLALSKLRPFDYDLDGKQDLLVRVINKATTPTQLSPTYVLRSSLSPQGPGFAHALTDIQLPITNVFIDSNGGAISLEEVREQADVFEVLDVDGNGLADIAMSNAGTLHVYRRRGNKPDLLTRITSSGGASTTVTYKPISDPGVYAPTGQCVYPQTCLKAGTWVVAEHAEDDGLGGSNHFRYAYEDGRVDVLSRAGLGFARRTITHVEPQIVTVEDYEVGLLLKNGEPHRRADGTYPFAGMPRSVVTTTPLAGGIVHERSLEYDHAVRETAAYVRIEPDGGSLESRTYFPYAQAAVEHEYELRAGNATLLRRLSTFREVDEYGNTTHLEHVLGDGTRQRQDVEFAHDPDAWLIAQPTYTTETGIANGETATRKTAYEYDGRGLLSRVVVEPHAWNGTTYTPLPQPQFDGMQTLYFTLQRDAQGLIEEIVESDAAGKQRRTRWEYDARDHMYPVRITNDLGHATTLDYHAGLGAVTRQTDPNTISAQASYDGFGRLRYVDAPDGADLDLHYWPSCAAFGISRPGLSECRTSTAATGRETITAYDALERPVLTKTFARADGRAVLSETGYDARGRITAVSRPYFETDAPVFDRYFYDNLSRPQHELRADGVEVLSVYDGLKITVKRPNGNLAASVSYSLQNTAGFVVETGDLLSSTEAAVTKHEYGPFGLPREVKDPGDHATTHERDRRGRVIAVSDPDAGTRTYEYTAFGELRSESGPHGTTTITYDTLGRPTAIDSADGRATYDWDLLMKGKLFRATSADGTITGYGYNQRGQLILEAWLVNGEYFNFQYGYDAMGQLQRVGYPQSQAIAQQGGPALLVEYQYGARGALTGMKQVNSGTQLWTAGTADASGRFRTDTYGNGATTTWRETPGRPGMLGGIETLSGPGRWSLAYGYYDNGSIESRSAGIESDRYEYDALGRLSRWQRRRFDKQVLGSQLWEYALDGNIRRIVDEKAPNTTVYEYGGPEPHAVTRRFDAAGTIDDHYAYEGGVMSARTGTSRPLAMTPASFDLPRLIDDGVRVHAYSYDAANRRVHSSVDDTVTLGGRYQRRVDQATGLREHTATVDAGGMAIGYVRWRDDGVTVTPWERFYLHPDHLGSPDVITSEAGLLVERQRYTPFGAPQSGTGDLPRTFTGHVSAGKELGLIDMGGRFYDPGIGRFLSPDPIVSSPYASQALNPYSYVMNRPTALTDPTGFTPRDDSPGHKGMFDAEIRSMELDGGAACASRGSCFSAHIVTRASSNDGYVHANDLANTHPQTPIDLWLDAPADPDKLKEWNAQVVPRFLYEAGLSTPRSRFASGSRYWGPGSGNPEVVYIAASEDPGLAHADRRQADYFNAPIVPIDQLEDSPLIKTAKMIVVSAHGTPFGGMGSKWRSRSARALAERIARAGFDGIAVVVHTCNAGTRFPIVPGLRSMQSSMDQFQAVFRRAVILGYGARNPYVASLPWRDDGNISAHALTNGPDADVVPIVLTPER